MLEPNGRIWPGEDVVITHDPIYGEDHFERPLVWEGGPIARLHESAHRAIRHELGREPRVGEVVTVGPYRIRLVSRRYEWGDYLAVRDGARARIYQRLYPLARLLRVIKTRIIWTAAVWGCAATEPYTIPRWRDLRWPLKRKARR